MIPGHMFKPIGFPPPLKGSLWSSTLRGSVPSTFQDLVKLPGVGAKVANLVLSVTFGQRDAGMVVDTHVFRVARRLGWSDARNPEETRQQLERFMSCDLREEVTLKLIAFGQAVCRPQYPKCQECLLSQQGICPTYQRRCTTAVGTPTTFQKLEPSPKRKRTLIDLEDWDKKKILHSAWRQGGGNSFIFLEFSPRALKWSNLTFIFFSDGLGGTNHQLALEVGNEACWRSTNSTRWFVGGNPDISPGPKKSSWFLAELPGLSIFVWEVKGYHHRISWDDRHKELFAILRVSDQPLAY